MSLVVLALVDAGFGVVAGLFTGILLTAGATLGLVLGTAFVHFGLAAHRDSWSGAFLVGAFTPVSAVLIANAVYQGPGLDPQPVDTRPLLALLGAVAFVGGAAGSVAVASRPP